MEENGAWDTYIKKKKEKAMEMEMEPTHATLETHWLIIR